MGIETAIATFFAGSGATAATIAVTAAAINTALITGAVSFGVSKLTAPKQGKSGGKSTTAAAKTAETAAKDKLVVTPKGIAKKNARTALVVGSPRGVLSIEDQTATSGRGTLLGN